MVVTICIFIGLLIMIAGVLSMAIFDPTAGLIVVVLAFGIPIVAMKTQAEKEIKEYVQEGGKLEQLQVEVSFSDYKKINSSFYKVLDHVPMKLPFLRTNVDVDLEIPDTKIIITNLKTKESFSKTFTLKDYSWKNIICDNQKYVKNKICFLYHDDFYKPHYKEFSNRKSIPEPLFLLKDVSSMNKEKDEKALRAISILTSNSTMYALEEASKSIPSKEDEVLNIEIVDNKIVINMNVYTKEKTIEGYASQVAAQFL